MFKICSKADNHLVYKLNRLRIKCVHMVYPTVRPLLISMKPTHAMNVISFQQRFSAKNASSHFVQIVTKIYIVKEQGNSTTVHH